MDGSDCESRRPVPAVAYTSRDGSAQVMVVENVIEVSYSTKVHPQNEARKLHAMDLAVNG
jgi:hypothetical protein